MPVTFWTSTIGFAALAGVVPTAGFFTKDSVLHGIWQATDGDHGLSSSVAWVLFVAALATTLLTAAYATRLWLRAFFGPASGSDVHEAPRAMTGPLVVLAAAVLLLSIGQPVHLGMGLASTVAAAVGIGAVVLVWRRGSSLEWGVAPLTSELGIDRLFSRWVPALVGGAARAVVELDRDAVDVYPRSSATTATALSRALGLVQSRNAQRYATIIAVGAAVLVVAAVVWS